MSHPFQTASDVRKHLAPTDDTIVGDWMETASGRKFYPLSPRASDVDRYDIAHHLGRIGRYNGAVKVEHYSVAEHSVLISQWLEHEYPTEPFLAYQGLMHDAPEAYIGDMVRPLKKQDEMLPFREAEDRIWQAIVFSNRMLLTVDLDPRVKEADNRIIVDERAQVMRPSHNVWGSDNLEPLGIKIRAMSPADATHWFLRQEAHLWSICYRLQEGN